MARDIEHELRLYLDQAQPAQVAILSLVNRASADRTLTVFAYRRLVLGTNVCKVHIHEFGRSVWFIR